MKIRNVILILLLLVCWQSGRAAGTDPNQIVFSVTFHHNYNVTNPIEQFRVFSGVPRYEAVLVTPLPGHDFVYVSDGGYKNAVWTPYDGIVKMPLGPMDGDYQVDFGLKGADDQPVWFGTIATLKRTAPQIFITNPANRTVATPYIQLQGYSTKELRSVTFDLSNAVAVATNQEGFLTGYHFDSVVQDFTINYFQCFDLPLTNGVNAISLHCTDLAGNVTTTNFNVTLDYSTAISPVLKITFPPNGLKISGGSFTLRGWTEDAVAQVTAQIVNTNGNTNVITGEVERDGKLWVENLPMSSGTNWLTLTVKNSAGLSSVTNLMLTKSDLVLTMNRVTDDLWRPTVNVTGYVSDTNDAVWVNGVKATVSGNGNWAASNVPVSKGGTASFDMMGYAPDEQQPDGSYGDGRIVSVYKAPAVSATNPNTAAAKTNATNQGTAFVATPEQPMFLKISQSNGTLYLTWSAVPNSTYQLQYVTELTATNWFNLGDPITATSNSVSATDNLSKDMQRLYHVKLVK